MLRGWRWCLRVTGISGIDLGWEELIVDWLCFAPPKRSGLRLMVKVRYFSQSVVDLEKEEASKRLCSV